MKNNPSVVTFSRISDAMVDIRDFQTTGVVAFAQGLPFTKMKAGIYRMPEKKVQIKADYLKNCIDAMDGLVAKL